MDKDISFGKSSKPKEEPAKPQADKSGRNEKIIESRRKLTIRQKNKVPAFNKLISIPSSHASEKKEEGTVIISDELKSDYIILEKRLSEESDNSAKEALIICSVENTIELTIDNNFLDLRKQCARLGYKKIERRYAANNIIALLYEQNLRVKDGVGTLDSEGYQKKFDNMLVESIDLGVSDIHIETRRDSAIVRYRVNGNLQNSEDWEVTYAREMATVIYQVIAAEKDTTFIESKQQAAIIDQELSNGMRVRVRLNTMPAYPDGFDVVMRILVMGKHSGDLTLDLLGYSDSQQDVIRTALAKPVGCTIIAGTTGSGKSTSLSTMITMIINENIDHDTNSCSIKVITVEDPPEYEIKMATQTPVIRSQAKDGENPFAEAMKAALRADPDILLVGEVRDEDSAELLVHAVQSGHKAFTTIHAPSGIGIIPRLRSLNVPNDVLGSGEFVAALIYQTLVPTICPHCLLSLEEYKNQKVTDEAAKAEKSALIERIEAVCTAEELSSVKFTGRGCEECNKGVNGRTVVAETILPDDFMFECFSRGQEPKAWKHYRQNGGQFALDHGIDKMKQGLCDPREVEHKLGRLTNSLDFSDEFANSIHEEDLSKIEVTSKEIEHDNKEINQAKYVGFDSKLFKESQDETDNVEVLSFGQQGEQE